MYVIQFYLVIIKKYLQLAMQANQVQVNGAKYSIGKQLGKGAFGTVYEAESLSNGQIFAIKIETNLDQKTEKLKAFEAQLQRTVTSKGVVRVFDSGFITFRGQKSFCIIQELMKDGNLGSKICKGSLTKLQALEYFQKVALSYAQLYKKKMIHRDLKPENILLSGNEVKIADFGLAVEQIGASQSELSKKVGTRPYQSPQQKFEKEDYTAKCDVFAMGCILCVLLTGKTPMNFGLVNRQNELEDEKDLNKAFEEQKQKFDESIKQFLVGCLQRQEYQRYSWEKVYNWDKFDGRLSHIPKMVHSEPLFKNIVFQSRAHNFDIIAYLKEKKKDSKTIKDGDFIEILNGNDISISIDDFRQLHAIFKTSVVVHDFQIDTLINYLSSIDITENDQIISNAEFLADIQRYANQSINLYRKFDQLENILKVQSQILNGTLNQQTSIDLSHSNIQSIPKFPQLQNLKQLNFSNNSSIKAVDARFNMQSLIKLSFRQCEICKISTIEGCPNLKELYIQNNKLTKIEGLYQVANLQILDISSNRVAQINNINHLKKLRLLDASFNKIQKISGIQGCIQLSQLHLQNNQIRKLGDLDKLMEPIPIKNIFLQGNKITKNKQDQQQIAKMKLKNAMILF